ncbi:MAG: ribose 5-phosphate isomerase B [Clostridia bacterium]|nr:ribose 5-phosphate isomerase B [Clostridia bacterium]
MKIAFGCDHGGFPYKDAVLYYLATHGHEVIDFGCNSEDSCDYPDFGVPACKAVANKEADFGILICGTGIGMSICANKIKGIRCAHVTDIFSAEVTRKHNDTNVIAMGARITTKEDVIKFIDKFLNTSFEGGRHEIRVNKIKELEK